MAKRRGRGRLSSIDLLPVEADEIVAWAAQKLRQNKLTQVEIGVKFNKKLAAIGIKPISPSAFGRHAFRLADMVRRANRTREIANVLTDRMEPGQSDMVTITLAEMIKTLIQELMDEGGEAGFTPKQAMELAAALKSAAAAEKMSSDRRSKLEAQIENKVDEVINEATKVSGLSEQAANEIKAKILGVKA